MPNNKGVRGTREYELVKKMYEGKIGKKSGREYIHHIHDGILMLEHQASSMITKRAWCLHPVVQADYDLVKAHESGVLKDLDPTVVMLAMEYRAVANAHLTHHFLNGRSAWPHVSSLVEVNEMLIADKIQNYKDYLLYVAPKPEHADRLYLHDYFKGWLHALSVSEALWKDILWQFDDVTDEVYNANIRTF